MAKKFKCLFTLKIWVCFPTRGLLVGREYWVIWRGPGFLAVVWFAPPPPLSRQQVVSLSSSSCWREGGGGGWGRSQSLVFYESFNTLCWRDWNESSIMRPWWAGRGSACSQPASGAGERCNPAIRKSCQVQKLAIAQNLTAVNTLRNIFLWNNLFPKLFYISRNFTSAWCMISHLNSPLKDEIGNNAWCFTLILSS